MNFYHRFTKTSLTGLLIVLFSFINFTVKADDGKTLFSKNCASCHALDKDLTGPKLREVEERWNGNRKNLHSWILNSGAYLKTGDKYANDLFAKWNKSAMTAFAGSLDDKQIDLILDYVKNAPTPPKDGGGGDGVAAKEEDHSLLYGILTLILAVVAFTLMQVNSNLKKLSDDKDGIPAEEPIPVWRNRTYMAFGVVVLVIIGGYLAAKGAIGFGRNKNYSPEQPIFYSHKVHAGVNQINCQYCHGGVNESKHANIPSVNVCMNCHMTISEYAGKEKLITNDGVEVNGTAEIQKLYKYAGYEKGKPWDASKAQPIEWVKIHNLPDHVYFNHSQHVVAGKQQCQTCHGEITKMDEVKQFTDLSMGWCINCHRETKVQFKENGFYSIYEKYHNDISAKMNTEKEKQISKGTKAENVKIDTAKFINDANITVEKIGGTECQKCHY